MEHHGQQGQQAQQAHADGVEQAVQQDEGCETEGWQVGGRVTECEVNVEETREAR